MKTPLHQFRRYVAFAGSRKEAAKRLGLSVSMVGHILTDRRGIAPKVAQAIEADTHGQITKASLRPDLWVDDNS